MINPDPSEGSNGGTGEPVALFTVQPGNAPKVTPLANHLLLEYEKPTMAGALHLPKNIRQVPTIVARVLAVGPDVKTIVPGQRVLILAAAIIGGPDGLTVEGRQVFLTQLQVVIATVD